MAKAKVTSTLSSKWVPKKIHDLDVALLEMSTDIHKRATILAPRDSGNLISSGRIERVKVGLYRIIFGSGKVPYARRRHYENFKNPQTLRYLERAGDSVKRSNIKKYIRK